MAQKRPQSIFNCPSFHLANLTEGTDILSYLDYLRDDLQVCFYDGFRFQHHTTASTQNGRHVFTDFEAAEGERLLTQAERLLGGRDALDEALNDCDIFNTPKFSRRHIVTLEEVCDLADYLNNVLRIASGQFPLGVSFRDYPNLYQERNVLFATHRLTMIEVALLARLLDEAQRVCEGTDFEFESIIDDANYAHNAMPGEIARVRAALRKGSLDDKRRVEAEYDKCCDRYYNVNDRKRRFFNGRR